MGRGGPEPSGRWGVQRRVLSQPSGRRYVPGRKPQVRGGSRPPSVGQGLRVNRGQRKLPQGFPESRVQGGVGVRKGKGCPQNESSRGPPGPASPGLGADQVCEPGAAPGQVGGGPAWSAVPMATSGWLRRRRKEGRRERPGPHRSLNSLNRGRGSFSGFFPGLPRGQREARRAALGEPGASGEGGTAAHRPASSPGTPTPWLQDPHRFPPGSAASREAMPPGSPPLPSPPRQQRGSSQAYRADPLQSSSESLLSLPRPHPVLWAAQVSDPWRR